MSVRNILGITIDRKLISDIYVKRICQVTGRKTKSLQRATKIYTNDQNEFASNLFIIEQFKYSTIILIYPLIYRQV